MNLRKLRTEKNYSQLKLASMLGVSRSAVAMWETGATQPDASMLLKISGIFGVSVDYLLGREETQIAPEQNEKISPEEPELNEGEKVLLELFRQIPDEAQKMYLEVLRASLKNQSKD